jgi:hypothetical protein
VGFGSGKAAASQQENADEYAGQTHGVANYMTCTKRVEICLREGPGLLKTLKWWSFVTWECKCEANEGLIKAYLAVVIPNDSHCQILLLLF